MRRALTSLLAFLRALQRSRHERWLARVAAHYGAYSAARPTRVAAERYYD